MEIFIHPLNIFTWRPVVLTFLKRWIQSGFNAAMWNLKNAIWPQRIHAASSWGCTDDEFSFSGGTESHPFIWVGSRQVRCQEQEYHKPCFKTQNSCCGANHSFKCHCGLFFWFMMSKYHHTCDSDDHIFHSWGQRQRALVPTSSAESGGHLPHCQTPERRENYNKRREKVTIHGAVDKPSLRTASCCIPINAELSRFYLNLLDVLH